ncbi:transmembrane protein 177 [Bombina bombina]|uniref:transmembrane protein 177 n=1 Tax=Bombina bombina TaxID=8345 RepID=UPI00235AE938|nr:transmembrane protein 177 [Bombina bombina]
MASPFLWRFVAFTQRHRSRLLAISSVGLFAVNITYHVFPEQTFRALYQGWYKGQPAELTENLQNRFQEVLQDLQVRSSTDYTPFAAFGFHPVSAGIPWLPSGCLIGIPANYSNTQENGVGIMDRVLMINGKEVDWNSEHGTYLQQALHFSVEAQKFSLAREVVHAQSNSPVIQAFVAPSCFTGVCLSGVAIKQILGLYSGPMILRGLLNIGLAVIGLAGYFLSYDAVSQWLDYQSDKKVASISKAYAHGGLEFYDKILARNRTLRYLMGEQGEKVYAPSGNLFPKYSFWLKHAPYTSRRNRIQHSLQMQKE